MGLFRHTCENKLLISLQKDSPSRLLAARSRQSKSGLGAANGNSMNGKPMNFLIIRAGTEFRLGSGISIKDEAIMFSSLHRFLSVNGLLHPEFEAPADWSDYELRASHLTDEGVAVIRCGLVKWLRAIDRGTTPTKVSALEKCLRAHRQSMMS